MTPPVQEAMDLEYDVVIVGGGPAGLAAAIRLKQLAPGLSVCLLEKGAELGAHQLSGALVPMDLVRELFPEGDWRQAPPGGTRVTRRQWWRLGPRRRLRLPAWLMPPALRHEGEDWQILSLGQLCQWLGGEAAALGVELFSGQAVVAGCYGAKGELVGVRTGDMGCQADGSPGPHFTPGIRIGARYTLVAEGARGSFGRELAARFGLGASPHFALGFKEQWHSGEPRWQAGEVIHTLGWPLDPVAGGGFLYASSERELQLGLVVQLDYARPDLDPFALFQQFKRQPAVAALLEGAQPVGFGARTLAEGGWQALGRLTFAGGALLGCSAGLLDLRRQQGVAPAIRSGLLAARACVHAIDRGDAHTPLPEYEQAVREGSIGIALREAAVMKPALGRLGGRLGPLYLAAHYWLQRLGWGLPSPKSLPPDHLSLRPEVAASGPDEIPVEQLLPLRDAALDRAHLKVVPSQPAHLRLDSGETATALDSALAWQVLSHCCPAGVYGREEEEPRLQPENCLHCKCCDIKDPSQRIRWTPPEGGSGPRYQQL